MIIGLTISDIDLAPDHSNRSVKAVQILVGIIAVNSIVHIRINKLDWIRLLDPFCEHGHSLHLQNLAVVDVQSLHIGHIPIVVYF